MTKIDKLLRKFLNNPKDFTWNELLKLLNSLGYEKLEGSGSRVKFVNRHKDIIELHKPHPENIVKPYIIKKIIKKLNL